MKPVIIIVVATAAAVGTIAVMNRVAMTRKLLGS